MCKELPWLGHGRLAESGEPSLARSLVLSVVRSIQPPKLSGSILRTLRISRCNKRLLYRLYHSTQLVHLQRRCSRMFRSTLTIPPTANHSSDSAVLECSILHTSSFCIRAKRCHDLVPTLYYQLWP